MMSGMSVRYGGVGTVMLFFGLNTSKDLFANCEVQSLKYVDRFNYRATHHMVEYGFYNFLNWFDDRAWYPLGRIVGGTVSSIKC